MTSVLRLILVISGFAQLFLIWRYTINNSMLFRFLKFMTRILENQGQRAGDARQAPNPALRPKAVLTIGLVVVLFLIGLVRVLFE